MRVVCALRHGTLCRNTPSMPLFEIVVLAIVQGITEFLPVSSSGHLRVASELMGITSDTLVMDVAVHVGTLGAVTLYLWRDVARIAKGLIQACLGRRNDGARLGFHVALATIPELGNSSCRERACQNV